VWTIAIVHTRGSRVRFTLVTISCGLCFATSIFFSVRELTLALPLVVLASVMLTQTTPWSRANAVLAVVSTGLLFFSHQSIVACAVILAGTALVRIKIQSSHQSEYCRNGSLGGRSGRSGVDPRVLAQPRFTHLLNVSPSVVILSVGAFFLLGWAALYGRIPGMKWFRWILLLIAVPLTFIGIRLAIRDPLCCHFVASSVRGCGRCAADAVTCRLDHWTPAMFRLDHSTRTN